MGPTFLSGWLSNQPLLLSRGPEAGGFRGTWPGFVLGLGLRVRVIRVRVKVGVRVRVGVRGRVRVRVRVRIWVWP